MKTYVISKDPATSERIFETHLRGSSVINQPIVNKGTSFTAKERHELGLDGLLPEEIATLSLQIKRSYKGYLQHETPIQKHIYLRSLQDRNETLFYALMREHLEELLPIVYTPVVGEACQRFHEIYRKPRGLFISYANRHKIDQLFTNIDNPEVKVIVVSDGERILGIGDLGVGGMGIPIGKISLYTACGGLHPAYGLPILLDVGTDNEELLNDPLYFGLRHKRIRGKEYDDFVELFIEAVQRHFPRAVVQWEDFAKEHAHDLLARYRKRICSFNDDIQSTAAVVVAGLLSAMAVKKEKLADQNVLFLGAGSAGTGIANQIVQAMVSEGANEEEARRKIWMVDIDGLLLDSMTGMRDFQRPFLQQTERAKSWKLSSGGRIGLQEVVDNVRPSILIGVSAQGGAFKESIIRSMARHTAMPVIFPLSNPTSCCEANPSDLLAWTEGRALIATGTLFSDVGYKGKKYHISQCNNSYIFPGLGLALISGEIRFVSDGMFLAAARALSQLSPALIHPHDPLFPPQSHAEKIAKHVAFAVMQEAQKEGLAPHCSIPEIHKRIEENFWDGRYYNVHGLDSMEELKRRLL